MSDIPEQDPDDGWFHPDETTFGDRVAGAREQAGLTQESLAKHLGVKLTTLRGWEDDLSEPRANRLQMLSGVLNVSLRWLLNGEGDGPETPADDVTLSANISEVLLELRQMKTQMNQTAERVGLLEKRLRMALKDQS